MKTLLTILLVTACGCPQKTTSSTSTGSAVPAPVTAPAPAPTPAPPTTPATPATPTPAQGSGAGTTAEPTPSWTKPAPGIGESCGANDACATGLTCVAYYGIAGARGPQFKTCEIKCKDDAGCPADHKCITIADGPGQVCRK